VREAYNKQGVAGGGHRAVNLVVSKNDYYIGIVRFLLGMNSKYEIYLFTIVGVNGMTFATLYVRADAKNLEINLAFRLTSTRL
jgi:hypothetical protein